MSDTPDARGPRPRHRRRSGSPAAGTAWASPRRFRDGKPHADPGASAASSSSGRTRKGELNVLDGYCRHMGGDLTQGTVKGDEIACPFHDWRWGGDGKCKAIPYARRVPLRARTAAVRDRRAQRPAAGLARRRGLRAPTRSILPPELAGRRHRRVHRLDLGGRRRSTTPTAASSSTTSSTWRTSTTCTSRSRRTSSNVFEGHRPPSSWSPTGRPDMSRRATATRTCSSSPRPPTTDRRT